MPTEGEDSNCDVMIGRKVSLQREKIVTLGFPTEGEDMVLLLGERVPYRGRRCGVVTG